MSALSEQHPLRERWRAGLIAAMGAIVLVNISVALGPLWRGADEAEAPSPLPADLDAIEPSAGDVAPDEPDDNATGDDAPAMPAVATGTPEYHGDGDVPKLPDGLVDKDQKVAEMTTFEHLADAVELLRTRLIALDEREAMLVLREKLLEENQARLDAQFAELADLHDRIQTMLAEKDEAEQARIAKLVKIYESMKAKRAGEIFDTLEMSVLLDVAAGMRESKLATVLQYVQPRRAEDITERLAARKKLPPPS